MKYYINEEVGSAYWLANGSLFYAPLNTDNTFNTEDGGEVEWGMATEEFGEDGLTFAQVWNKAMAILKA